MSTTETDPAILLQEDGSVRMRIYPHTGLWVAVTRPTALHLFALACRYNATLRTAKWSPFWRRIKQIERSMTVMLVEANSVWGLPIAVHSLLATAVYQSVQGQDFQVVANGGRRRSLTDSVEKELATLYRIHIMATVPKDAVLTRWKKQFPEIVTLLHNHSALEKLLEGENCYDDKFVFSVVHSLLLEHGHDVVQGGEGFSHAFWCSNDAQLFAGCVYE